MHRLAALTEMQNKDAANQCKEVLGELREAPKKRSEKAAEETVEKRLAANIKNAKDKMKRR